MGKIQSLYSDKPLLKRVVLLLAGLSNFLVGYAIYYIIKDDKSKEFEAEFIQRGAAFGLAIFILGAIFALVKYVFGLF